MEGIRQDLQNVIDNVKQSVRSTKEETSSRTRPQSQSLVQHKLDIFDCPLCDNTGYIWWRDPKTYWDIHSKECECMEHRRAIRRMDDSGLAEHMRTFSFDSYETPDEDSAKAKQKAQLFTRSTSRGFLITGQSGAGKTHLCVAICHELVKQGFNMHYMRWRRDAPELKGKQNEPDVQKKINVLCNIPVLYIDDFLKGSVTNADLDLAFAIINDRYIKPETKTIISTELSPNRIVEADEAVGGRILEMSRGFIVQAPSTNWRTK